MSVSHCNDWRGEPTYRAVVRSIGTSGPRPRYRNDRNAATQQHKKGKCPLTSAGSARIVSRLSAFMLRGGDGKALLRYRGYRQRVRRVRRRPPAGTGESAPGETEGNRVARTR